MLSRPYRQSHGRGGRVDSTTGRPRHAVDPRLRLFDGGNRRGLGKCADGRRVYPPHPSLIRTGPPRSMLHIGSLSEACLLGDLVRRRGRRSVYWIWPMPDAATIISGVGLLPGLPGPVYDPVAHTRARRSGSAAGIPSRDEDGADDQPPRAEPSATPRATLSKKPPTTTPREPRREPNAIQTVPSPETFGARGRVLARHRIAPRTRAKGRQSGGPPRRMRNQLPPERIS